MKIRVLLLLTLSQLFLMASSCENPVTTGAENSGRCNILKAGALIACEEYKDGIAGSVTQTECASEFASYSGSNGADDSHYLQGNNNNCDPTGSVGYCQDSQGFFFYYVPEFDNSSAQTDCTGSRSGTYTSL